MAWRISVSMMLLATAVVASAVACPQPLQPIDSEDQQTMQADYYGSCATIGYRNKCCPPFQNLSLCKARNGDCYCDMSCHHLGRCCSDAACNSK